MWHELTVYLEDLVNMMGDEEQQNLEQLQDMIERDSNQHPLGDDDAEDEEEKLRNQEKADEVTATKNQNVQEAFPYKGFSDEDKEHDGDLYGEEIPNNAAADVDKRLENARQESKYGSKEASEESESAIIEPAKDNLGQNGADDIDISDNSTLVRERRWLSGSRRQATSRRTSSSGRRRWLSRSRHRTTSKRRSSSGRRRWRSVSRRRNTSRRRSSSGRRRWHSVSRRRTTYIETQIILQATSGELIGITYSLQKLWVNLVIDYYQHWQ